MADIDSLEHGVKLLIEAKKMTGQTIKQAKNNFIPDSLVDKVVKNDPARVGQVVRGFQEEFDFWKKSILPDIGKTGRLETVIKTWIVRIMRAVLGVPFKSEWSPEEQSYCKIDTSKDKILNRLIFQEGRTPKPNPTIVEAVINCSSLHFKVWQTFIKNKLPYRKNSGSNCSKRFYPLYQLVDFWYKIINSWYTNYHDCIERDSMLAFVCSSAMFKHNRISLCCNRCIGIHYTANDHRVSDYVIKLFLELVLSPHIHIEWKLEMSKYLTSKGIAMVCQAFGDISEKEPFQPCAARFWDFCKSERPPYAVEFAFITPEPSSMPCLSSGAGVFGNINAAYSCPKIPDSIPFKALAILAKTENPSTRRWIEEGSVLMFNMYPMTVTNAPVGYGRRTISNWKFRGSFTSSIISSVVTSRKRRRNVYDKGSRSSDLLSEGTGKPIKTVLFNCKNELDDVSGNRLFDKTLSFEGDLLGGVITKQQLEKYDTVNLCFPKL